MNWYIRHCSAVFSFVSHEDTHTGYSLRVHMVIILWFGYGYFHDSNIKQDCPKKNYICNMYPLRLEPRLATGIARLHTLFLITVAGRSRLGRLCGELNLAALSIGVVLTTSIILIVRLGWEEKTSWWAKSKADSVKLPKKAHQLQYRLSYLLH